MIMLLALLPSYQGGVPTVPSGPSQVDFDRGGTLRQWESVYMGPSVGWQSRPSLNQFPITIGGVYMINLSTSYVPVNATAGGAVTIILPPATNPQIVPGALPGPFIDSPIVIADVGGNAGTSPITIQAAQGETVMGLSQIQIAIPYGAFTLSPNSAQRTWSATSP